MSCSARRVLGLGLAIGTLLWLAACQPDHSIEDVRRLQQAGDYAHSIAPLRAMLDETPDASELHYLLGVALRRTGTPSLAIWPLRRAIEDPEWFWQAAVELVESAMASGNPDLAIRITTDMIDRDDTRFDAWLFRAEARIARRQEYEEALEDVDTALDLRPDSYAAQLTRASTLLLLQRPEEAESVVDELEQLVETTGLGETERAKLCLVRSSLLVESGKIDEASERLDVCLERFPSDLLVVQTAVTLLETWGERERARQVLLRAVELQPTMLPFRLALSQRLQVAGQEAEAETLLREVAEGEAPASQRQAAWVALADHYLAMKRYAPAARAVGQALDLNPEPVDAEILTYADLLAMAGDHEEARKAAARLERSEYRDLIEARILLREKRPDEALEHLDRVLKIWPDNAAARYYAARAAEQTGDLRRAVSEYRDSIRADAGFTDAGSRLARLHLARREFQPAIRAAYHHLNSHPNDREAALTIGTAMLGKNEPIPDALTLLLSSPEVRGRWISLQVEQLISARGQDTAIAYLERINAASSAAGSEDPDALRCLIDLLRTAGRVPEARTRLQTMARDRLPRSLVRELEGRVLRAEGKLEAARTALSEAVEADPANEAAHLERADVLLELGFIDDALASLDRASALSPMPWIANHRAASALFERGSVEAARARLEDSLREHPHDARSVLLLGEVCLQSETCRAHVPEIARRARFLGQNDASEALMAAFDQDRNRL